MFIKQWRADYQGNIILVENTWGFLSLDLKNLIGQVKLYINGKKVDDCAPIIRSGHTPVMHGQIDLGNGILKSVEIYMKTGFFSIQTKICVDDVKIGGDNF